jgi:molecular chaperone DnaK (HSP70)
MNETADSFVFYLGGGNCSASVITVDTGILEVMSSSGTDEIGGLEFDDCILQHII